MALVVLDSQSNSGRTKVVVRVRGDTYEESRSQAARELAQLTSEIRSPGIDPTMNTYPVDEKGECDEKAMMTPNAQVSGYCTEFIVHG